MSEIRALTVPKWGIEMQEGTITGWLKQIGEPVAEGEALIDIETDKIVNTVESPFAGVLRRTLVGDGEVRKVGELIGVLAPAAIDEAAIDAFVASFVAVDTSFEPAESSAGAGDGAATSEGATGVPHGSEDGSAGVDSAATGAADVTAPASQGGARARPGPVAPAPLRISPVARKVADRLGVNLSGVVGTGRNGRISKADVDAAAAAQGLGQGAGAAPGAGATTEAASEPVSEDSGPSPSERSGAPTEPEHASGAYELVRLTGMQRTAARRLQAAKQEIPHFYLQIDIEAARLKKLASRRKVSVNTVLLKAYALALDAVPEANVQYADEGLRRFASVDLGMAVSTPRGLMVPVLRDVAGQSLKKVDEAARDLAERGRARKLGLDDLEGGAATVSNLGMFGIDRFSAIVNPPQTSILAVGRVAERPVVGHRGKLRARPVLSVTLSCDHRAIDGALGARVLAAFRSLVESGLEKSS